MDTYDEIIRIMRELTEELKSDNDRSENANSKRITSDAELQSENGNIELEKSKK